MKGAFYLGNGKFEVREQVLPPLGREDILVRNMVCGICGTDVHIYHGQPGSAEVTPPVVLGHEYSGVVEKVGQGVTRIRPGDRVTIDPNIYCGACPRCRDGKKQLCESMEAIGVTRDGGFAEYSVVPASQAYVLDAAVSFEDAAMAEPLACCIHGADLAGIRTGDLVHVIGGGAIGLLMVQLAKLSGAALVVLSEPSPARREIGLSLGADAAFNPLEEDSATQMNRLTGRSGADVVIECVGIPAATRQAFDTASHGATVLLFSVPAPDATAALPLFDVFKKELTIRGSFVNPDTHGRAVALLNQGKIQVEPLITHRYRLEQLDEAVKTQMGPDSIKVVVTTAAPE